MSLNPLVRPADCAWLVLADDLSGAAECAAVLPRCRRILLDARAVAPAGETSVIDLDSRRRTASSAARLVGDAVRRHAPSGNRLFKKADSLLRGRFAAETAAFAAGAAGLVVAPAVPAAGRTVRGGVVHLDGVPLHRTDAWRAEAGPVPRSVAGALAGARATVVPLDRIRAGATSLDRRLRALLADGTIPVCDAETDADLDAVAGAALRLPGTVRLAGAGGLAAALGRLSGPPGPRTEAAAPGRGPAEPRPVVVVVGTAHPAATAQIEHLTLLGARHVPVSAAALLDDTDPATAPKNAAPCADRTDRSVPGPVRPAPFPGRAPVTVFSIGSAGRVEPAVAPRLARSLARVVVATSPRDADLVLTGGETARCVLDALRVTALLPVAQVHHGAVHCRTGDGRGVVTRPGGFGGPDSLLRMVHALRAAHGRPVPEPPPAADRGAP
ncbi:four-carbon acid sugar kinase family protein [Streptomyces olivaceus]|uniref:four-carbon acid sugar kinase family protein n=1 Tax=Streptomyces TaxID=1883 RepID=UPI001FB7FF80|nr:four-carbon acid sugar kinase family protein [Streptomyces sp. CB09030]UOG81574.1 four-carbon acid sugar kinase family protein [Streptomyces sp. CB09030]